MKKILLLLILASVTTMHAQLRTPKKVVFNRENLITEERVNQMIALDKSQSVGRKVDSFQLKTKMMIFDMLKSNAKNAPKAKLILEIKEDEITLKKTLNGEQKGFPRTIHKNDSITRLPSIDIFTNKPSRSKTIQHTFKEYLKETKEIKGIKCFQVVVTVSSNPVKVYTLYVTKELDLPLHCLYDFDRALPNYFPMEATVFTVGGSMEGPVEKFTIDEIEF